MKQFYVALPSQWNIWSGIHVGIVLPCAGVLCASAFIRSGGAKLFGKALEWIGEENISLLIRFGKLDNTFRLLTKL